VSGDVQFNPPTVSGTCTKPILFRPRGEHARLCSLVGESQPNAATAIYRDQSGGISSGPKNDKLGIDVSILEFMFDTTRMLTNMIFSGVKKRFSKIKIISTHGGGTIPYLMTRIETLEQVFGPGKGRAHLGPEEIREGLASFYYDLTAATSPTQLFGLQQMVPLSHLMMGFDKSVHAGMDISTCHSGYAALERLQRRRRLFHHSSECGVALSRSRRTPNSS
jgi:hypothetical protein